MKQYWIYIMSNNSNKVLYIGMTNNLVRRISEHKQGCGSAFTSKCKISKLVYSEMYTEVSAAICREKELKGWLRKKKDDLIDSQNPDWKDLWFELCDI